MLTYCKCKTKELLLAAGEPRRVRETSRVYRVIFFVGGENRSDGIHSSSIQVKKDQKRGD